MLRSFVKILLSCSLLLTACGGDNSTGDSDARVIRIGWVYSMANAPVLIAKEKGLYKKAGVRVELYRFPSGPKLFKKLLAGKLDMAYIGAAPVFHWHAQGLKTKILAKVNYGQAVVLARADSGIVNVSELKGKKIAGVRVGSGMDVLLRGYVIREAAQLNPASDLEILTMKPGNMGAAVENNIVDAAFCWEPFTSQYILKGKLKIVIDINKAIPKYPWYVIAATDKALNNKEDLVLKVLKSHKQAIEYLNSSDSAGNEIIAKYFLLQKISREDGTEYTPAAIVSEARNRVGWSYKLNDKDVVFLQRLVRYSRELKYLRKDIDVSEIIDTDLMRKAAAQ